MPPHESLDELLARHAAVFADQVQEAAKMADTEEDIRIAIENQLAFIKNEAGITLVGKHEVTVISERIDSVYNRVIIEYKNPASHDRLGSKLDSQGTKKVVELCKHPGRDGPAFAKKLRRLLGDAMRLKRRSAARPGDTVPAAELPSFDNSASGIVDEHLSSSSSFPSYPSVHHPPIVADVRTGNDVRPGRLWRHGGRRRGCRASAANGQIGGPD